MKKTLMLFWFLSLSLLLGGCSSTHYASRSNLSFDDDLYEQHDRTEILNRQKREEAERKAAWDAQVKKILDMADQKAAEKNVATTATNGYESVLADTYESAYARRLRGSQSLSYRMPSSYENARYGEAFHYVSAYDPAVYNIVISGDDVWVEPKYITSMFGVWGADVVPVWGYNSFYMGWGAPYFGWHMGFGWRHAWHRGWYDPWYAYPGWGFHPWYSWDGYWGCYPWYGGWGYRRPHNYRHDHYRPSYGGGYRPSTSGHGGYRHQGYNRGSQYNRYRGSGYNRGNGYNNNHRNNRYESNKSTQNRNDYRRNNSYNSGYRNNGYSSGSGSYQSGGNSYRSGGSNYNRGR